MNIRIMILSACFVPTTYAADSLELYVTPGILKLVADAEKELREDEVEINELAKKAERIEKIRIVRQVLKKEPSLLGMNYQASLVRKKEINAINIVLSSSGNPTYSYELLFLNHKAANLLCTALNQYLDPSKRAIGERTLRNLMGLEDEALLNGETLKALLNKIRATIVQ